MCKTSGSEFAQDSIKRTTRIITVDTNNKNCNKEKLKLRLTLNKGYPIVRIVFEIQENC